MGQNFRILEFWNYRTINFKTLEFWNFVAKASEFQSSRVLFL